VGSSRLSGHERLMTRRSPVSSRVVPRRSNDKLNLLIDGTCVAINGTADLARRKRDGSATERPTGRDRETARVTARATRRESPRPSRRRTQRNFTRSTHEKQEKRVQFPSALAVTR